MPVLLTGQPPKRFRQHADDNINDMETFFGRGTSKLRGWTSRARSKKSTDVGHVDVDEGVSPTAAAAEDKLPV